MKNKLLKTFFLFLIVVGLFFISEQVFLMDKDETFETFTPSKKITEDEGVDFPTDI